MSLHMYLIKYIYDCPDHGGMRNDNHNFICCWEVSLTRNIYENHMKITVISIDNSQVHSESRDKNPKHIFRKMSNF